MANKNKQGIPDLTGQLVRRDLQIQTVYERKESTNNRRKDRKQEAGRKLRMSEILNENSKT